MAIHLVGETLNKHTAHARAEAGELVALYRGVYVDAADNIDLTVAEHAIRIAAYLYPHTYLSGASAAKLSVTDDGRLFLSGRRKGRNRIRGVEIIVNEAPPQPSTVSVVVGDGMGELNLTASSPRQRFLEAFRRRSEHASAIDPSMRRRMAERLLEEYGSKDAASDALWTLGRANKWIHEAEAAEQYLKSDLWTSDLPGNQAAINLVVAWHGDTIGSLVHDGAEWRWIPAKGRRPPLVRETRPGSLPPFIESLLPEGWLAHVLNQGDRRDVLRSGRRYMSNMTIVPDGTELSGLPADVLEGRLDFFQRNGLFTGNYLGPARQTLDTTFQEGLARIFASEQTPRLSGVQIKAPMCLREDGDLITATNAPFTHILKPAGTDGFENLPMVEWICLNLAKAAMFEVPGFALVPMPDGMKPALLVERFDIRRSGNDTRRLALEDFCSVLDLEAEQKYDGTIERIARGMRPLSTDPGADIEILFGRTVFAWLIADGDMHLKNLALLKIANVGEDRMTSVRFAPVYDVVTTRVFPRLHDDKMALKLAGKDDRLTPKDFLELARTIELTQGRAAVIMADCARRLVNALPGLETPIPGDGDGLLERVRSIVLERANPFL